jgi:protein SCO1/2
MTGMTWRYILLPCIVIFVTFQVYLFLDKEFNVNEKIAGPTIGGNFHLINTNQNFIRATDYRGRLMLVYFGFTHCPDICPTDLQAMTNALNALGEDAKEVAPIFITLDPARDTPSRMKEYLDNFHPDIEGLTGEANYIDKAAKMYKVFHNKVPMGAPGDYMINHSGYTYLMSRNGQYLTHFAHNQPVEEMVAAIRDHL